MNRSKVRTPSSDSNTISQSIESTGVAEGVPLVSPDTLATSAATLRANILQAVVNSGTASGNQLSAGALDALMAAPVTFGKGTVSIDVPGYGTVTVDNKGVHTPDGGQVSVGDPTTGNGSGPVVPSPTGGIPIPYPTFTQMPISIPILTPQFTTVPVEIPIPLPTPKLIPWQLPDLQSLSTGFFGTLASALDQRLLPTLSELASALARLRPDLQSLSTGFFGTLASALDQRLQLTLSELVSTLSTLLPTSESPAPWVSQIKTGVTAAVDAWTSQSRFTGGTVNASIGTFPAGALQSAAIFAAVLQSKLSESGVPSGLAQPFADVLARTWDDWFAGYAAILFYPALQFQINTVSPPTPNVPQPLSAGMSTNRQRMLPDTIAANLNSALGSAASSTDTALAVRQISVWFSARFVAWCSTTWLFGIMGWGTAPTALAPMPAPGPVVGGTLNPGEGVLTGPNVFQVP